MALLLPLLTSLKCPFASQMVFIDNRLAQTHVQSLVVWLEDRIIRELEVEEREPLRQDNDWIINFNRFVLSVGFVVCYEYCITSGPTVAYAFSAICFHSKHTPYLFTLYTR